jgi:PAS domain S-box-containing protein
MVGRSEPTLPGTARAIGDESGPDAADLKRRLCETEDALRRSQFLLDLNDRLRRLEDADAIIETAAARLGHFLSASRVAYGEFDEAQTLVHIEGEWTAGVAERVLRHIGIDAFGTAEMTDLTAGRTLAVADARHEDLATAIGPALIYARLDVRALAAVPLVRNGRLAALLYVAQRPPRHWSHQELALVEHVAERIFAAVEAARTETALRESEARFRTLAETLPALVWIVDPGLRLSYANARWTAFSGLPPHEALGYSWKQSVHPEDVAKITARVAAMRGHEASFGIEMRYRAVDGTYRWHMVEAEPVRNFRGELVAWLGASVDIHDRKAMEAALRESEERLALAQRAARIGAFDWHIPSRHVTWTTEQERLFGIEPGTFENTFEGWSSRVLPDTLEATNRDIADAIARRDREIGFAYSIRWPDGSIRHIEGRGMLFYEPDGNPLRMVGVNIDVTSRHNAEERQHLLIRELHHRVKNTLATVQAIVSATARNSSNIDEFYQGFVGRIVSLAQTHNLLTDDDWQTVSLEVLLWTELGPYKDSGSDRIRVSGPPVELPSEAAVPVGMAIHELTTNAAKHGSLSGSLGTVDVTWWVHRDDTGAHLHFAWTEEGGPAVATPTRQGFGSRLLQRVLTTQLQADVHMDFDPGGLRFTMVMPLPRRTSLIGSLP